MISPEAEKQLLRIILLIANSEKSIEEERIRLSGDFEFAPRYIFDCLDSIKLGELGPLSFKSLLEEPKPDLNDQDLHLLIRQYSTLSNGRINFQEFLHLVLPATRPSLWDLIISRFPTEVSQPTEDILVSLLDKEITYQKEAEIIKQELYSDSQFSGHEAFRFLDTYRRGQVTAEDLRLFCEKHSKSLSYQDTDAIFRRVTTEDKLFITYSELIDFLMPLHLPSRSNPQKKKQNEEDIEQRQPGESQNKDEEANQLVSLDSNLHGFFITQILLEREAELLRQNLAINNSFSVAKAFEMSSQEAKVIIESFEAMLSTFGIGFNREDVQSLFQRFSNESELDIAAFSNIFVPKTPEYSKKLDGREPQEFDDYTLRCLQELFDFTVQSERKIQAERQKLSESEGFDIEANFRFLDRDRDGVISIEEMNTALVNLGLNLTEVDLYLLINRYDNGVESGLDLEKFKAEIMPKNGQKQADSIRLHAEFNILLQIWLIKLFCIFIKQIMNLFVCLLDQQRNKYIIQLSNRTKLTIKSKIETLISSLLNFSLSSSTGDR